jgi:hypothetical protein
VLSRLLLRLRPPSPPPTAKCEGREPLLPTCFNPRYSRCQGSRSHPGHLPQPAKVISATSVRTCTIFANATLRCGHEGTCSHQLSMRRC